MGVVKEKRFDRVRGLIHKIDELESVAKKLSKMRNNVLASEKQISITTNSAEIHLNGSDALDVIEFINTKTQSKSSLLKDELDSYMKD